MHDLIGFTLDFGHGKTTINSECLLEAEFHTGWTTYSNNARCNRLRSGMQAKRVQVSEREESTVSDP